MKTKELEVARNLMRIFMPFALERKNDLLTRGGRFVHYTSAENALKIIKTQQIWMRNTQCMDDYMEVEHGIEYLLDFFQNEKQKEAFITVLNKCIDGVAEEAIGLFDEWLPTIRSDTYITCISEHDDTEDRHGRLSMWRAYGRDSIGVGIVVNTDPFMVESDALKAYSSPISYLTEEDFRQAMFRIIQNIESENEFLRAISRSQIQSAIYYMLLFAATCSKHPGFHEEREWRIIHLPKQNPSEVLIESIEIIGGVPQKVFKIPLKNIPEEGLVDIEIPQIVNRIIIGPSAYPVPIYNAFVDALKDVGMENPESKIVISLIPLRM